MEEFWAYQDLLSNFVMKLSYCVTTELIPLMEITGVKQVRLKENTQRLLYERACSQMSLVFSEIVLKIKVPSGTVVLTHLFVKKILIKKT